MKRITILFTALLITTVSYAKNWQACIAYYAKEDTTASWETRWDNKAQKIVLTKWESILDEPTISDINALDPTAVETWWKDKNATDDGNEIYDGDMGKLIQAVLVCLKAENPTMNLPSKAQVIAKFKQLKEAE